MQRIRKRLPRRFRLGVPAASALCFRVLPGRFRAGFVCGSALVCAYVPDAGVPVSRRVPAAAMASVHVRTGM